MYTNLDMDCLRTFVTIVDVGSFAEAGQRIGRTAPAVSLQITRLEEQIGSQLFQKQGRRMILNPAGERLVITARKVLNLNDEVIESLSHQNLIGEISIGMIQDFADTILPTVLARFKQAHPQVRIIAKVDRTKILVDALESGALDIAIGVGNVRNHAHQKLFKDKMIWLGSRSFKLENNAPVPLVVFDPPCSFRDAAIHALNCADREWEITFTSPSLSGLKAAVEVGLGITARTATSFNNNLCPMPQSFALPQLPSVDYSLYAKANLNPSAKRLSDIITEELSR